MLSRENAGGLFLFVTAKQDGSRKLALRSKLINKQIYQNLYQMPDMIDLVDKVAIAMSGDTDAPICFSNFDLKFAY